MSRQRSFDFAAHDVRGSLWYSCVFLCVLHDLRPCGCKGVLREPPSDPQAPVVHDSPFQHLLQPSQAAELLTYKVTR